MSFDPKSLDAQIPQGAVSTRQQSGVSLSYLEGWYVIDRANKIFGHCNWSYSVSSIREVQSEQKGDKNNWYVGYLAVVKVEVNGCHYEDVGFGQGIDKDLGKAHESATKEAVTDGVKRCLKNTGMSMGLALYDKSKSGVGEETKVQASINAQAPGPSKAVADWLKKHIAGTDAADNAEVRKAVWSAFTAKFGKDAEKVLLGCDDLSMAQSAVAEAA